MMSAASDLDEKDCGDGDPSSDFLAGRSKTEIIRFLEDGISRWKDIRKAEFVEVLITATAQFPADWYCRSGKYYTRFKEVWR